MRADLELKAGRRLLLAALPASLLLAPAAARADFSRAPDVTVFVEPTLVPLIGKIGEAFQARTRAPVRILAAPSSMLIKEIPFTLDDVMIVQGDAVLADAVTGKAAAPDGHRPLGRNGLVIARRGAGGARDLASVPVDGAVAIVDAPVPDALGAASHEVLGGLHWPPEGTKVFGVARGADALFLLRTGAASLAVVYRTDVVADPSLSVAATLPDPAVPLSYAASLSRSVSSRFASPFMDFLATPEAAALLRAGGLEITA